MDDTADERPAVQRIHDRVTDGMDRRSFLRAAVNVGIGAGMVQYLSVDDFLTAPDDEVPIVYGFAHGDSGDPTYLESRTKTVPAAWYNSVERAFDINAQLHSTDIAGLIGSFVAPGEYDGGPTISVDVTEDAPHERIAELLGDVTFDINEIGELPPSEGEDLTLADLHGPDELSDREVPGGVPCTAHDSIGTLAPAMYAPGGESPFFTTANHVYGAEGAKSDEHRDEPLEVLYGEDSTEIGRVVEGYPNEDFVRVRPTNGYSPVSEIYGASPANVVGQFTKYGLADLQARGEPLEMRGTVSGHATGQIKGVDGVTCYAGDICKHGQLLWGDQSVTTDGDSGSVSFHADPENPNTSAMIAGFNNARTWWPGGDYAWGTAAYHIWNEYDYHF